jgi:hypothetical protein
MARAKLLLGAPLVSETVRMLFDDHGIKVHQGHVMKTMDLDQRIATFNAPAATHESRTTPSM